MPINSMALLLIAFILKFSTCVYPIAVFHGIGDSCTFTNTTRLVNDLSAALNTHVECIEIGNGFFTSIFTDFKKQSEEACLKIQSHPHFQSKFSILGISQGSLIGRYVIEACPMNGQVMRYLSFDGPQMGLGSLPLITCPLICNWINLAASKLLYTGFFERHIAPSRYYKYRYRYDQFLLHNSFLNELNNEARTKNEAYKRRFAGLERVMLLKGKYDRVITPKESSWFEFYDATGEKLVPLRKSQFYVDDYIGIRKLDEEGRLYFGELEGQHVIYNQTEFKMHFVPFFGDERQKGDEACEEWLYLLTHSLV